MKHILIICNYFAPDNTIAAVRTTKIAKYLVRSGYRVTVITEKKENAMRDELLMRDAAGVNIKYAENSKIFKRFDAEYKKLIKPLKNKRMNNLDNRNRINPRTGHIEFYPFETAYPFIGSIEYLMMQIKQIDLYKSIKNELTEKNDYDCILTSYGDSLALYAGRRFHKCHKDIPWIFDIRDAVYRYKFTPDYVKLIPLLYEKYIWKNADAIVGVSKGICKRVPQRYRNKVYCITNGYDTDDAEALQSNSVDNNKLTFAYTGSMYGGLQNLSFFFRTIRGLIDRNVLDSMKIEFRFAGNDSAYEIFKSQAQKYELQSLCVSCGKLTREQALQLQKDSCILLMASYDYQNNVGGILTGKLMEYMMMEKPVIAVVTGDIERGEVYRTIKKTGIGEVFEESHKKEDYVRLSDYIEKQYTKFTNDGELYFNPDYNELNKYNYRNITDRIIKIIEKPAGGRRK